MIYFGFVFDVKASVIKQQLFKGEVNGFVTRRIESNCYLSSIQIKKQITSAIKSHVAQASILIYKRFWRQGNI